MKAPTERTLRRLWLGMQTLSGIAERGIFIPYRHADTIRSIDYPAFANLFNLHGNAMEGILHAIEGHAEDFSRFGGDAPAPRFEQDWFPRLDLAAAYAVIRRYRPDRIVEIGSGHSTRAMVRAIADGNLDCELICIDPAPRAVIEALPVTHHRTLLSEAPREIFSDLGEGQVLFIDSSHVAVPGSDVDILFNTILPALGAGCLIHVHDIFLPWAYPEKWTWRGYNEQLLLAALLQSGAYEPLFASQFVSRNPRLMALAPVLGRLPFPQGAFEASFWMRKCADSVM